MQPENREQGLGPIIGLIVILVLIIVGGLYFWSTRSKAAPAADTSTETSTSSDADVQSIGSQSTSDDAGSIQADLDATNVDTVDSSLQQQQ